jgi:hypothetical protein
MFIRRLWSTTTLWGAAKSLPIQSRRYQPRAAQPYHTRLLLRRALLAATNGQCWQLAGLARGIPRHMMHDASAGSGDSASNVQDGAFVELTLQLCKKR